MDVEVATGWRAGNRDRPDAICIAIPYATQGQRSATVTINQDHFEHAESLLGRSG